MPSNASPDRYLVSKGYAHYVLFLLFVLMAFDFIDRQVLASLLPYMKREWSLTDTQLGALISAVNVSIAVATFPVAVLVDRWSRTKSIGLMTVVWTLATAACAFTKNYGQLLTVRVFIGAGEAGYGPGGVSLLSALFPRRLRATVLGIFQSAALVGAVVGVVLGGYIAAHWGWRYAFGIVALPGLIFALLIFFVRDYKTVQLAILDREKGEFREMRWREAAGTLFATPTLLAVYLGNAAQLFFSATLANWLPSFFNRVYNLPGDQAGLRTGLVILVAGLGAAAGGYLVDKWTGRHPRRRMLGPALLALCTSVLFVAAFARPSGATQQLLIFLGAFLMLGVLGPIGATTQDVVHPGLRAMAVGGLVLVQNLLGMALGPLVTGMLSDRYELQTALAIVSFIPLIAALAYFAGSFTYEKDLAKVGEVELSVA